MIAFKSLFRVNIFIRQSSITCVRSKPWLYFQNRRFWHGFSCELKMDARKGRGDGSGQIKPTNVTRTWRAVSTQPNYSEGDGEMAKLKNPVGEGVQIDNKSMTTEKYSISMEIGASLMRFVKGKWGVTQKKLEEENGIKIIFPSSRKEDIIIIEGNSAESVTQAYEKIQSLIDKTVNSREFDYSHFVSLPLAFHPELVDKLFNFQNTILGIAASDEDKKLKNPASETSSRLIELGIEKSIFINPKTFHLTVLMLKLWNKERVKTAAEVLQSVSSKVLDALENRPVLIGLKGLDLMKGFPAKARVVYAPVEEIGGEGRLLRACKVITDAFVEAGLVMEKDAQHHLKLHATLMNARHRKRNNRTRNMDSFDARGIFEMYGSEEWGVYPICQAHLSQMFEYDDNGYYSCCASIPFPESATTLNGYQHRTQSSTRHRLSHNVILLYLVMIVLTRDLIMSLYIHYVFILLMLDTYKL